MNRYLVQRIVDSTTPSPYGTIVKGRNKAQAAQNYLNSLSFKSLRPMTLNVTYIADQTATFVANPPNTNWSIEHVRG